MIKVKSANRSIEIMELLTREPFGLTLSEISQALDLPVSSTYEILRSLVDCRMLSLIHKRYSVGLRLFEISQAISRDFFLLQCARPYVLETRDRLKSTIHLAALDQTDVVYLSKVNFSLATTSPSRVGVRLPAHLTALGKVMLSKLSDENIYELYKNYDFKIVTKNSTSSIQMLITKLNKIRHDQYAFDAGEYIEDLYCVAVPVVSEYSDLKMALSCSSNNSTSQEFNLETILDELNSEASNIAKSITFFYERYCSK